MSSLITNWLRRKLVRWALKGSLEHPEQFLHLATVEAYSDIERYKDFRAVFGTPQGQRVLRQILRWTRVWQSTMASTPHEMAFSEGERNVGLKVLAALSYRERPKKQTGGGTEQ